MRFLLLTFMLCSCHPFGIQETDTVKEAEQKIIHSIQKDPEENVKIHHERIG